MVNISDDCEELNPWSTMYGQKSQFKAIASHEHRYGDQAGQ